MKEAQNYPIIGNGRAGSTWPMTRKFANWNGKMTSSLGTSETQRKFGSLPKSLGESHNGSCSPKAAAYSTVSPSLPHAIFKAWKSFVSINTSSRTSNLKIPSLTLSKRSWYNQKYIIFSFLKKISPPIRWIIIIRS